MNAYGEDLAYVHDAGFTDYMRKVAPAAIACLRQRGILSGLVVELGCGSGVFAHALLKAGYDVLGIDYSPYMLRLARRRARRARFVQASIWSAELPNCVAILSFGECLNYLFDARMRRDPLAAAAALFARAHAALAPGGVFLFDLATPGRGAGPELRFRQQRNWAVVARVREDHVQQTLTREIVTFRRVVGGFRRSAELHRTRLFRSRVVAMKLRRVGFRVTIRTTLGGVPLGPGMTALLAVRSARRAFGS